MYVFMCGYDLVASPMSDLALNEFIVLNSEHVVLKCGIK